MNCWADVDEFTNSIHNMPATTMLAGCHKLLVIMKIANNTICYLVNCRHNHTHLSGILGTPCHALFIVMELHIVGDAQTSERAGMKLSSK